MKLDRSRSAESTRYGAVVPEDGIGRRLAVSACLAGVPCRYNGAARPDAQIVEWVVRGETVAVCPEVMAGLPTPRPPAEIVGGDGDAVLAGRARVVCADGTDVTAEFVAGARQAAAALTSRGVTHAVLQAKSPTCGCGVIYDGTHTGALRPGDGVFTAELRRRGIHVESRTGVPPTTIPE